VTTLRQQKRVLNLDGSSAIRHSVDVTNIGCIVDEPILDVGAEGVSLLTVDGSSKEFSSVSSIPYLALM